MSSFLFERAAAARNLAQDTATPEEKATEEYRFRLEVPQKATASLPVEEVRTLARRSEKFPHEAPWSSSS